MKCHFAEMLKKMLIFWCDSNLGTCLFFMFFMSVFWWPKTRLMRIYWTFFGIVRVPSYVSRFLEFLCFDQFFLCVFFVISFVVVVLYKWLISFKIFRSQVYFVRMTDRRPHSGFTPSQIFHKFILWCNLISRDDANVSCRALWPKWSTYWWPCRRLL